jgi:protein TonB
MRNSKGSLVNLSRLIIFLAVAILHIVLILSFVIRVNAAVINSEPAAAVMKLTDLAEEEPLPPPPPPVREEPQENAVESIAENMIATETVPDQVVVAPGTLTGPPAQYTYGETENYLPMHKISIAPVFSEREIAQAIVYPPIALRSGLEGTVYLELFIDRQGTVQQIRILKEDPADKGFGAAAVRAFTGLRCKPAEANGEPVAVRYRYPVRFSIKG